MLTGELCDESKSYFVAFRSEFVVSRARLRAQPLATYQKLHSYVGVRPSPRPLTAPAELFRLLKLTKISKILTRCTNIFI